MTPREPDRSYDAGHDLWKRLQGQGTSNQIGILIAALRKAEASALERAAQECLLDSTTFHTGFYFATPIRALIPPAAAPAAEPVGYCMARDHSVSPHPKDEDCVDWEAEPSPPSGYVPGITHEAEDRHTPTWEQFKTAHPPAPAAETGKAQGDDAPDPESRQSLIRKWMDERKAVIAAEARIAELCNLIDRIRDGELHWSHYNRIDWLAASTAPPKETT